MEQLSLSLAIADAIASQEPSFASFEVADSAAALPPARPVWPTLSADIFGGLGSNLAKVEANLAAIEVLRTLQTEGRHPTPEERTVLTRYTGWGAAPKAFTDTPWDSTWAPIQARVRQALSAEEFEAAKASTPNAHYTDVRIVERIWSMISALGFKGGRVLEPAAGVGYFIGAMPSAIAAQSEITAIELDRVSAEITRVLYEPYGVRVLQGGFESISLPDGAFDLAVTNVPFGRYQVADTRKRPYSDWSIHNWFIARMLDAVRPGGLVVVITSTWTMDSVTTEARKWYALQADLLGAVRLPFSAFESIANTEVTTDILVFQRRSTPLSDLPAWAGSPDVLRNDSPLLSPKWPAHIVPCQYKVNPLYADANAANRIVGAFLPKSNGFGLHLGVAFDGTEDEMLVRLDQALATINGRYTPSETQAPARQFDVVTGCDETPIGSLVVTDGGSLARLVEKGVAEVITSIPANRLERVRGLIAIRDVARRLAYAQVTDEDDRRVDALRAELNAHYDAFVARFGPIHSKANRQVFRDDPGWPLLLALEVWDAEREVAEKADIFRVRTVVKQPVVTSCETADAALTISLARTTRVDPGLIAALTGRDEADVMQELADKGLVFREPVTGRWVDRSTYLSGNIAEKLGVASWAGHEYARNVEALRGVLPKPLGPGDIRVRFGAPWIPTDVVAEFLSEVVGVDVTVTCKPPPAKAGGFYSRRERAPPTEHQAGLQSPW